MYNACMQCYELLPGEFIQKITKLFPQTYHTILSSFCSKKPVSIRINTLKTTRGEVEVLLKEQGINYESVFWCDQALIIRSEKKKVTELSAYKEGLFYIQNLSSMLASVILDPKPHETVLDMCAAPGSKTSHMAMLMQNTGTIMANDTSRNRLFKLTDVLKTQGVTNSKIINYPGEMLWKKYPNYFDKTLVDVPCSMEGRFLAQDEKTYADWTPKKTKQLATLQKQLLSSAFIATKPGGTIVYATCTLSPEENEAVVNELCQTEKYPFTIEKTIINIPYAKSGLAAYNGTVFHEKVQNTLRVMPNDLMEGFFIAKIVKEAI